MSKTFEIFSSFCCGVLDCSQRLKQFFYSGKFMDDLDADFARIEKEQCSPIWAKERGNTDTVLAQDFCHARLTEILLNFQRGD